MYSVYERLRDERKLTDYAVAKALGIGRSTFSEWKRGDYTPKYDKLKKIADYFGVTTDYLQNGKDETPTDRATLELWYLMKDSAFMEALKVYNQMAPEKKKRVIDLIHLIGAE